MIVLDCGVVLTDHGDAMARMARELGVEQASLEAAYWAHRLPYDAGRSDEDYWALVLADLGRERDDELARRLTDIDLGTWARIRPASRAILEQLAERGEPTMMLSNAGSSFRRYLEAEGWTHLLGQLVISGEEGCTKPDARIHEIVEERAGTTALRFIDDRQANIDAALARGWDAHLWVSDDDTAAWLGL